MLRREWPEETHDQQADLTPLGGKISDDLTGCISRTSHDHDYIGGIGCAIVIEQVVAAARDFSHSVHIPLHNARDRRVEGIASLAVLEEHIGVLRRATGHGMLARERPIAERLQGIHVDERGERRFIDHLDLLNFMRGAEAVEEMKERDSALDGSEVRHGGEIHHFLHRAGGKFSETRAARRHHIAMVPKDG